LLTDKDGKQDAKEDDDDEDQLHVVEPCVECINPDRNFMLPAGSSGYGIPKAVSRADWRTGHPERMRGVVR